MCCSFYLFLLLFLPSFSLNKLRMSNQIVLNKRNNDNRRTIEERNIQKSFFTRNYELLINSSIVNQSIEQSVTLYQCFSFQLTTSALQIRDCRCSSYKLFITIKYRTTPFTYVQDWTQVLYNYYFIFGRVIWRVHIISVIFDRRHSVMLILRNLNLISVQSWTYLTPLNGAYRRNE